MRNIVQSMIITIGMISICLLSQPNKEDPVILPIVPEKIEVKMEPVNASRRIETVNVVAEYEAEEPLLTQEDIDLIALVTMAEAEGESDKGKRLVIDTILNRVDSDDFPNTIYDVIYQKNQFTSMWNGRVNRCYVDDDICKLVEEELKNRTNNDVLFFHAGKYGKYGNPLFAEGNHYFSS